MHNVGNCMSCRSGSIKFKLVYKLAGHGIVSCGRIYLLQEIILRRRDITSIEAIAHVSAQRQTGGARPTKQCSFDRADKTLVGGYKANYVFKHMFVVFIVL